MPRFKRFSDLRERERERMNQWMRAEGVGQDLPSPAWEV